MKKIRVLALSDLHLGEEESLLNICEGQENIIETTVKKIGELSKGRGKFEPGIEKLILIGDIVELSEAKDEPAYNTTKFFLSALLSEVPIQEMIYLVGNHDHHLWVEALTQDQGKEDYRDCEPKTSVFIDDAEIFVRNCLPPDHSVGKITVGYPYYTMEIDGSFFFFDHGHLFSELLEKLTSAEKANDLEDLEERTYEKMEFIWYESKSRIRERFWDLYLRVWHRIKYGDRGTSYDVDSHSVLDDYSRRKIIWYLTKICGLNEDAFDKDFHFVFGHTHHGGRVLKGDRKIRVRGRFINVWNTGAWVVPSKVFSPDAYIFYIEQTGRGIRPATYKLVAKRDETEDGDYPRDVLDSILG